MFTLSWELFSYSLPLKEPLFFFGRKIFERKGLILRLNRNVEEEIKNNIFGEGEITTLPGVHKETFKQAEKQIINYLTTDKKLRKKIEKEMFPSVSFGLDMAKRTLANNLNKIYVNKIYDRKKKDNINDKYLKIPVNGLALGSGSEFVKECKQLSDQGFQTVKIKVGKRTINEDLKRVKLARKILGDKIDLRLDANRSWNWSEALKFFYSIKDLNIQYCEEPLRDIKKIEKLYEETKIPFALDETIWKNPNPEDLPKLGIKAYILKPCILGGWSNTKFWIDYAEKKNIQVILSSSFESGLGLNWNAYIAVNLVKNQLPTGLDTSKWFVKDIINPSFNIKNGFYIFPDSWPKARLDYLQHICKGTIEMTF